MTRSSLTEQEVVLFTELRNACDRVLRLGLADSSMRTMIVGLASKVTPTIVRMESEK